MQTKNKRTKKVIQEEKDLRNTKIARLTMEIGQDNAEYIRTKDIGLKRSLDLKVKELGSLEEAINLLDQELKDATE